MEALDQLDEMERAKASSLPPIRFDEKGDVSFGIHWREQTEWSRRSVAAKERWKDPIEKSDALKKRMESKRQAQGKKKKATRKQDKDSAVATQGKEEGDQDPRTEGKKRKSDKLRQLHQDQGTWLTERLLSDSEVRKGSLEWRLAKRERSKSSDEAEGTELDEQKEAMLRARKREYMRRHQADKTECLQGTVRRKDCKETVKVWGRLTLGMERGKGKKQNEKDFNSSLTRVSAVLLVNIALNSQYRLPLPRLRLDLKNVDCHYLTLVSAEQRVTGEDSESSRGGAGFKDQASEGGAHFDEEGDGFLPKDVDLRSLRLGALPYSHNKIMEEQGPPAPLPLPQPRAAS
ncbi:hypothetical protein GUITHDRAFT_141717 [Guillardia theta CCMP2712]|uniref:Uncharacterized protein n=1 Tax=Guillardia theta (strain CCMP2712) TaxID=905079 RepID=L1J0P9_GUITC|nr:hypothetical protein GUITHDRAFT_141717 [Guillardia theta CCMP2712]EKX41714.1 hypothetical protein GUITHDRAFT_141717 [Guillardia theta CCMP2712]|eukprot:XP_005828694.1 hypothetical protein GUITHDRAFT_141717 [Guillardia theta CCMP2712]